MCSPLNLRKCRYYLDLGGKKVVVPFLFLNSHSDTRCGSYLINNISDLCHPLLFVTNTYPYSVVLFYTVQIFVLVFVSVIFMGTSLIFMGTSLIFMGTSPPFNFKFYLVFYTPVIKYIIKYIIKSSCRWNAYLTVSIVLDDGVRFWVNIIAVENRLRMFWDWVWAVCWMGNGEGVRDPGLPFLLLTIKKRWRYIIGIPPFIPSHFGIQAHLLNSVEFRKQIFIFFCW